MPAAIEDYGLIGDGETAALVSRDGSIDWLCWPRFDSEACLAALLGDESHGAWRIAPLAGPRQIRRRYEPDTLILETLVGTADGEVAVLDFMPPRADVSRIIRLVEGRRGAVDMSLRLRVRFGYGQVRPWTTRPDPRTWCAIAGPDMAHLRGEVPLEGEDEVSARFRIAAGERVAFELAYRPSHLPPPEACDSQAALQSTRRFWRAWSEAGASLDPRYAQVMRRALITLKALIYAPTGGLIAAPTTSLPEAFGGVRNWDYRYSWLRDATLALLTLVGAGHCEEARAWGRWLQRALGGAPADLQIMYGAAGERRLAEWEACGLPGYQGARPVRIGNAAFRQFQLDVFGELLDALHHARRAGLLDDSSWPVERAIVEHVASIWPQPDAGIWESRGPPRHYTFSKIMAWVAIDRGVKAVEDLGLAGPRERWRDARDAIRADVLAHGLDPRGRRFKRAYDEPGVDASLLLIGDLGFVAHDDPLFAATVSAVEQDLLTPAGLLLRYDTRSADDGLPPGEAAFLPCSFWLANAYAMLGRLDEARRLFERLIALSNDLGLLAEEYDTARRRFAGNFPQAFSHVGLLSTALALTRRGSPSRRRPATTSCAPLAR